MNEERVKECGLFFRHSMGKEMMLLAIGALVFFIGWLLQRRTKY